MRCFIPRGGMRRRSGFALCSKPESCPFPALARRSGEGLDPMAASVQPFAREPITALLLSPPDQGAIRSDFRVANPPALDRTAPEPLREGCSPRVSASLACRASYTSLRRGDHVFLDLPPCRCQPVDLLTALDHILDASKQLASAAAQSLEHWKVSRQRHWPWTGLDLQAILAR
jgi:hypothetical protein